jgi:hypothetical protein
MKTRTLALLGAGAAALTLIAASSTARAQQPPPGYNPYAPPPPSPYYAPPPSPYYAPPPAGQYAGPRVINDWDDGQPIPPGYHKSTQIRKGLVIGGAVTFGVVYLLTAIAGAVVSDVGDATCGNTTCPGTRSGRLLLIPVAGPFALLGATGSATANLGLVLDGLLQAGGVAMLIGGLAAPKTVLVRDDVSKVKIMPKPMIFGQNGAGVGLAGSF